MDYIVKKALSLTNEEKTARGIVGIPENWPVEIYPFIDVVPELFEQISDVNLILLRANNQAAYDAWLAALSPIVINAPVQLVQLSTPAAFDDKPIVQASPRPIGTYTYLSAQSDNPLDPSEASGGIKLKYSHAIGQDNANQNFYFDINSIRNETHLNGAYLQWADANLDEVEVEICCKSSEAAFVAATNTNYKIVSGVLIMTAGDGDISIPDWDLILPVQMVANEHGVRPAGYWDASYNTATHKFENYVFNASGAGEFNIFSEEIEFNCFIPSFPMLKCAQQSIESKDVTRLGHNMRIKALIKTESTVDDHAWKFCAVVYLYRKHT